MNIYQTNRKIISVLTITILLIFNAAFSQNKDKISELKTSIDEIVKSMNCDVSVQIASATKYDLLYEYQPEKKMIPASISKVVTSAIDLQYIGTGYEFKTVL